MFDIFDLYKKYPIMENEKYEDWKERYIGIVNPITEGNMTYGETPLHDKYRHEFNEFLERLYDKQCYCIDKNKPLPKEMAFFSHLQRPSYYLGGIHPIPWRIRFPSPATLDP